ncbi:MAG: serine hydrolase, partial [Candidatus Glassbacteria bacterium]|nr:serine hydrolase [Candidatus Glassbacteria bacterium]
ICEPLGMRDTRITLTPGMKARLAQGHDEKGDPAGSWDFQALAGAGALRSTADDMLVFLAANLGLQESGLLPVMQKTHLPRRATELPEVEVAMGWHVSKKYGSEIVWHNGGTGGYRSFIGFDRQKRLGVVVLSSSANSMDDLGYHLLDERYELARMAPPSEVELDPALYSDYAGCYELAPGSVFTVSVEDSKLMVQLTGQGKAQVFPESETEFFYKVVDARITFEKDDKGEVSGLVLHQGGLDLSAIRLGDDYRPPPPRKEIQLDAAVLEGYVGKYELAPGAVFTATLEDGRLMVQFTGQGKAQVFPESETGFFYKAVDAQITFEKDTKGAISGLVLHQGGEELRARKVE